MEEQERAINKCVLGVTGPQPMLINQIIGTGETQKSLDLHMRVPRRKPAIEQIIDVFVKKPCITHIEVITDKVIVRGHFEVKTIYVACIPSQPVHAVEARRIRFTADIPICGARCGMDADASIFIEYVDYECDHHCRPYWHKQWDRYYDYQNRKSSYKPVKHNPKYDHDCDEDYECDHKHHYDDDCDNKHHNYYDDDCDHNHYDDCDDKHHHHDDCDCPCPPKKKPRKCCREFDVSIVIRVDAKVMSCREIMLYPSYPSYPSLPIKPKG